MDPRVYEAMRPYFTEVFGNPASSHSYGERAHQGVENARQQIAELIGASPQEVVFTSGATESNNLVLKGITRAGRRDHFISSPIEHKSVLDCLVNLRMEGKSVTFLPVDESGVVDLEQLELLLSQKPTCISIMFANNEVGTIQPVREIGEIARAHGVVFHCDAAQAVGKVPVNVDSLKIDLLSISAHKFYGPKGIGALYVRREVQGHLEALISGGGHERGLRSGTLNVPGCVGLGEACRIAAQEMPTEASRTEALRDRLWSGIQQRLSSVRLNGHPTRRLPGNLNVSFLNIDAEAIMANMPEIAVSSGSACSSAVPSSSHVLQALGMDEAAAEASIRFGVGRFTTPQEIDATIDRVCAAVDRLKSIVAESV